MFVCSVVGWCGGMSGDVWLVIVVVIGVVWIGVSWLFVGMLYVSVIDK